jgi:hypothetical protein
MRKEKGKRRKSEGGRNGQTMNEKHTKKVPQTRYTCIVLP